MKANLEEVTREEFFSDMVTATKTNLTWCHIPTFKILIIRVGQLLYFKYLT